MILKAYCVSTLRGLDGERLTGNLLQSNHLFSYKRSQWSWSTFGGKLKAHNFTALCWRHTRKLVFVPSVLFHPSYFSSWRQKSWRKSWFVVSVADGVVRSRWRTKLLATLYILLVDLVVILLQELILKLDHGWSHLGMFIVDRLHSTWLFSLEALQLCAVGSSSTSLAMHQVLQLPSLLFPSESLSVWFGRGEPRPRVVHRRSCSFVEAGRLVYMSLVIRVTSASVRLCFGRCGSCTSLTIRRVACSSVAGGAAIATAHVSTVERAFCFWGESLCCMFYIHLHSDIIPLTIISVVPFYRKSWVQLASSWLIAGINEWLLSSESFQLCCGGSNTSSLAKPHDHLWWMTLR